ncbi:serine carboxypeptidase S28-domain-containing protein [Tirmania nivea]|nr:serine carboxypeptidase S28-domain-containing protein [Tirmania nivea]
MVQIWNKKLAVAFALLSSTPTTLGKRCFHEIQIENRLKHLEQVFGDGPTLPPPATEVVIDTTVDVTSTIEDLDADDTIPVAQIPSLNASDVSGTVYVPPTVHNGTVILPINHFGRSPAPYTFANRFWVVDQYYKPGGPVFTFDTGETSDGFLYRGYLTNNASFFNQYLREFGAMGVLWEHRYYGQSLPYPINWNTTSENLRWLTTEQALKDFVVFANKFKWKVRGGGATYNKTVSSLVGKVVDLNPKRTPWVHVGGSYPGVRAAMLRDRYPETVFAAYASSAPIQASTNMTFYWDQVYRGLVKYGYENCTRNIKSALDYIDSQLTRPDTAAVIKQTFLGRTAENNSNGAFSDVLFYPLFNWQSSGADLVIQEFCAVLEDGDDTNQKSLRQKTGKVLADRWAKWKGFVDLVNEYNPEGWCEGFVQSNAIEPNCNVDERFTGVMSISWTWQYCTEWGFLQATNLGPHALGSKFNTLQHQQDLCYRQFPDGLSSGYLPRSPREKETNRKFGGWNMRPSNVFWTGGEFDPWRTLSQLSGEDFSNKFQTTTEIPRCNVKSTTREPLFGYLLSNAEHAYDFNTLKETPKAVVPQRLFAQALKEWLKCFRPRYE